MIKFLWTILFTCVAAVGSAQPKLVDKVVAVVGDKIVLFSDIELQFQQLKAQNPQAEESLKCRILEEMLLQKMFLMQAEKDSIVISEDEVENEMDRRLRYFISLIGSQEKLEEYYNKSILQIKEDFREDVKEQLLINRMRSQITSGIKVTPSEVKAFYGQIPEDSLPYFNAEVSVGQIVMKPKVSPQQKEMAEQKAQELRERIMNGEDFATLAMIYSEDPGSASKGGELGFTNRGDFVAEFEAAAFSLKPGEVSKLVKTQFGYHIIQLIEKRGERVNVRHILVKPKITSSDIRRARDELDSVAHLIRSGKLDFEEAVEKFSEDEESKSSAGILMNPQTGTAFFEMSELDQSLFFVIDTMKKGQISDPAAFSTQSGETAFRIIYLKEETDPHVANLKQDYNKIQAAALSEKKREKMQKWLNEKIAETYLFIDEDYLDCPDIDQWFNKQTITWESY